MNHFHPAVKAWFNSQFNVATQPQLDAWHAIASGNHALIAAPTGSGKTLAAFMDAIDGLVKQLELGTLQQQVNVIYVSPLKALSNDIERNLQVPLRGIQQILDIDDLSSGESIIQAMVRTGDTSQWQRTRMIKTPPHILVTTPESLYILLTSESGRKMLSTARTLIVDEIHVMVSSKRGAHLALSMERLQGLCAEPLTRVGLSATQEPVDVVARFLTGERNDKPCQIINSGHQRNRDLQICLPQSPLQAIMAKEEWSEIHQTLEALIESHTTTLIFVNTRRLTERLAKALAERLGEDAVTSHHGSLAKEHRFSAEQRLKSGTLKALVATASLELGIDIGDIDLVCQIGSPRAVSVFLQRVGRSGHSLGKTPKGRLFPLSRDDLVECVALLDAVRQGELDQLSIYPKPLDVLAQQIVAEVASGEIKLDDLYDQVTTASPFYSLTRKEFDDVIRMLSEGFSIRRGRWSAYIHHDAVNQIIKPRKGARLSAITNGGTIPDQFDYDVVLQPEGLKIGTLNEDFSFESLPGDVFQLGNTAYQILKVELGKVFVRDARGMPPNIPFWFGEAPGRTDAMSAAVSRIRKNLERWLPDGIASTNEAVIAHYQIEPAAAAQMVDYLGAAWSALGALPSADTVIFERFFDEAGDQHLVVHSAFGSRVNRAWGLALRKRFCRKFNFELQVAALEDTIILSLGATHSFPLEEPAGYLKSESVEDVLTQALLDAPMFPTYWRWNATVALAIRRFSNGQKTPPQFQRSNAEDLIAMVFPDQIACAENIAGAREIPDHPLVSQTLYDCLNGLMDVGALKTILDGLKQGNIQLIYKDLTSPSALSEEVLSAKPYAFLDDAPAEERRTALVRTRQFLNPEDAEQLGQLDQQVIKEVKEEAWPSASNYDECHDALMILGGITELEAKVHQWHDWLSKLVLESRATKITFSDKSIWVAAEKLEIWLKLHHQCNQTPEIKAIRGNVIDNREQAIIELLRMRLQSLGPVIDDQMVEFLQVSKSEVIQGLHSLEQEGYVMRGYFTADNSNHSSIHQWCERGLLARIHRRTINNLRKRIQPVSINGFMRYLFCWQGLDDDSEAEAGGPETLIRVLQQLEGIEVAAGAWEEAVLPCRLKGYMTYWLDILCSSGRVSWLRLNHPANSDKQITQVSQQSAITLSNRQGMRYWQHFSKDQIDLSNLSSYGKKVHDVLKNHGAQFFDDLVGQIGLALDVERGLAELVNAGRVNSDNYSGLRGLINNKDAPGLRGRRGVNQSSPMSNAGRWSLNQVQDISDYWDSVEYIANVLLRRYGVVFRKLLDAESNVPSWRELQYVLRRMEARGEIRGGRFVSELAGEQFALPEAVGLLRKMERDTEQNLISISAADPLNMTGLLIPGSRIPALRKNRILFENGCVIASLVGDEVNWLVNLDKQKQWRAQQKLICTASNRPEKYQHHRRSILH